MTEQGSKKEKEKGFGLLEAIGGAAVASEAAVIVGEIIASEAANKQFKALGRRTDTTRMAFSEMSGKGKTAVGAIALGGGLAAAYLINHWRNGGFDPSGDSRKGERTWVQAVEKSADSAKTR